MYCEEYEQPLCRKKKVLSEQKIDCLNTLKVVVEEKEFRLDGNTWEGDYSIFFKNTQPEKCPMN